MEELKDLNNKIIYIGYDTVDEKTIREFGRQVCREVKKEHGISAKYVLDYRFAESEKTRLKVYRHLADGGVVVVFRKIARKKNTREHFEALVDGMSGEEVGMLHNVITSSRHWPACAMVSFSLGMGR